MKRWLRLMKQISILKTVYYNIKLLPFSQARYFPIAIGRHSKIKIARGGLKYGA